MDNAPRTAEEAYAAIKVALRQGNEELADAIDQERKCPDCSGYVSTQGVTVDPDHCCSRCEP